MDDLSELIRRQRKFQDGQPKIRTIDWYSDHFNFDGPSRYYHDALLKERKLRRLVERYLERNGHVVYIDLGCGNGLALRGAKMHAEHMRYKPETVRTYGIDVLEIDKVQRGWVKASGLLDHKYDPVIIKADISTVEFPEKPDIVTCVQVLQYVEDPLKVFANAARQLPIGATLLINGLANARCETTINNSLFVKIAEKHARIPGFEVLSIQTASGMPWSNLIMLKVGEQKDFTYGYVRCSQILRCPTAPVYYRKSR